MTLSDHHANLIDPGMRGKGFDCVAQQGFTAKDLILFGKLAPVAAARSGCDD